MKRVLFFGDSNTYGYEPGEYFGGRYPASVRWADRLAEALSDTWEILPYGMNGRCIPEMPYEKAYMDSLIRNAGTIDVFAVMLGTNDVILTAHPDAKAATRSMERFLDYLQEKDGGFRILLIAPPAMDKEAEAIEMYRPYVRETKELTRLYEELAAAKGVDHVNADAWNIDMAFDFVHFSKEGHRIYAEKMEAFLREF